MYDTHCTAVLVCEHLVTVTADELLDATDNMLDCFACKMPRAWVRFFDASSGYHFACKNCRYRRYYSQDARLRSASDATKHAVKHRHTVVLYLLDQKLEEITCVPKGQTVLF